MNYTDAITYLKEHDIRKDDGTFYEFGDVSAWCIGKHFVYIHTFVYGIFFLIVFTNFVN